MLEYNKYTNVNIKTSKVYKSERYFIANLQMENVNTSQMTNGIFSYMLFINAS